MDLFTDVKYSDLSEGQREVADLIGFHNYRKLVEKYDGELLPIPRASTLLRPERNRSICREWMAGKSPGKLAKKYDLTCQSITNIIKKNLKGYDESEG